MVGGLVVNLHVEYTAKNNVNKQTSILVNLGVIPHSVTLHSSRDERSEQECITPG